MPRIQVSSSTRSRGVTIVELVIALTLIPIITAAFALVLSSTLNEVRRTNQQTQYDTRASLAMEWLERDVRFSKSFHATVEPPYQDMYGPDQNVSPGDMWDFKGATNDPNSRVLILSIPSTSQSQATSTRKPVFLRDPYGCGANETLNPTLNYFAIFYVRDSTLYKRYLTQPTSSNPSYTGPLTRTCGNQVQKQSCLPSIYPGVPPAGCQARDEVLATNVSRFSIDYYSSDPTVSSPIANTYTTADPTALLKTAEAVMLTLTLANSSGAPIDSTIQLKVTKVN